MIIIAKIQGLKNSNLWQKLIFFQSRQTLVSRQITVDLNKPPGSAEGRMDPAPGTRRPEEPGAHEQGSKPSTATPRNIQ